MLHTILIGRVQGVAKDKIIKGQGGIVYIKSLIEKMLLKKKKEYVAS